MTNGVKISELNSAASLDGTETMPVVQAGATVKATAAQITTLAQTNVPAANITGTLPVAHGGTGTTTSTGTGSTVLSNNAALVTPDLGTPSAAVLTHATGLPISTGVSGLGTGVATALATNVGSAGAPVVNGGALGTPSSGTATNLTGLPLTTGVTGTLPIANGGTNATTANNAITSLFGGYTGTGDAVRKVSPTLTTPNIDAATGLSVTLTPNSVGSPDSTQALVTNQYAAGTVTGATSLNHTKIWSDAINATNSGGSDYFVEGWTHEHYFGGSTVRGGRQGLTSYLYLTSATNASNDNRNYVGSLGIATAQASDGGSGTAFATSAGALFGLAGVGVANNGATNLHNVTGAEFNVAMQTGSSVYAKSLIQLSGRNDDAVQGSGVDAMLWAYKQGSSAPAWTHGILFNYPGDANSFPFNSSSTVMATGAGTIGTGIDFSATTVSSYAFKSPSFSIDGSGAGSFAGGLILLSSNSNGAIEIGGVNKTPFIDFHSYNGTPNDYDVRIQASGGTGTSGNGTLGITAAQITLSGLSVLNGTTLSSDLGPSGAALTPYGQTYGYNYASGGGSTHNAQIHFTLGSVANVAGSGTFGPASMDAASFSSIQKTSYLSSAVEGEVNAHVAVAYQGAKGDTAAYLAEARKVKGSGSDTGSVLGVEAGFSWVNSSGTITQTAHCLVAFGESAGGVSGGQGYGFYSESWGNPGGTSAGQLFAAYYAGTYDAYSIGSGTSFGTKHVLYATTGRSSANRYFDILGDVVTGSQQPGDIIQGLAGNSKILRTTSGGIFQIRNDADSATLFSLTNAGAAGFGVGSGAASVTIDGGATSAADGSYIAFNNAGVTKAKLGNASTITGGAYTTDFALYLVSGGFDLYTNGSKTFSVSTAGAATITGSAGIGSGSGSLGVTIDGGASGAADGAFISFKNAGVAKAQFGNASTITGAGYTTDFALYLVSGGFDLYTGGAKNFSVSASGVTTLYGALKYGGVTLSNSVTGTGSMVLSASPTMTGTLTVPAATFASGAVQIGSDSNGGIEIGGVNKSPYLDWHSYNGTLNDYDVRMQVTGGTGSSGAGTLTIYGGTVALSGAVLQLGNAYVAGAPAATGYVTIKDSAGTTYKVLVST